MNPLSRRPVEHRTFLALLVALLVLGVAPSASFAQAPTKVVTLSSNDPSPAAGSPVTVTATTYSDCAPGPYTFTVDGAVRPAQTSASLTTTFATPGGHTVAVSTPLTGPGGPVGNCGAATDTLSITVGPGVSGTIAVSPDPALPGQAATLAVTPTGGLGSPYTGYRWTIDGVADPAGNDKRTYSRAFTAGSHTVRVTFSDTPDPASGNPPHSGGVTRTITAATPTPPPPGAPAPPPAPTPPPCLNTVAFALSELKTDGCFAKVGSNPDRWTTTDQVKLNGIPFADSGQLFTITGPAPGALGGRIKTDNAAVQLDRFVPFSGDIDWPLPAGETGQEALLREVTVPSFARLFKLRVPGTVSIRLGLAASGRHYAKFPLNVELPPAFTAGPTKSSGGVSGAASISVDDAGVNFDALKVSVKDVWVGKLKVPEACFSYVAAGEAAVDPCQAPSLDGKPYLTCATDVTTERFDGSAVVELPTQSKTRLAAFGGLAGGQVSKLGGFVDNLGTAVPIVPGVFLNRVGIGLCLAPPPFKLRGDVGVGALNGKLAVNGRFTYTDATESSPWRVDVGGNIVYIGTELGSAEVGFNAWGDVNLDVQARIALGKVASISGRVNGWIEARNSTFNIAGSVQGCIGSLPCATASGLVSSSGIAGCLDLGTYTIFLPDEVKPGPFFGSVRIITRKQTLTLKSGVGYVYGGNVSLLGNSCDFAPYTAVRSPAATRTTGRAAAVGMSEQIRPGAKAVTLRVRGTDGPPKLVVRGPGGTTITSPQAGTAVQEKGRFLLAENPSDGTTSVLLIKPAAGTWTVGAAPGATSTPTGMDRSNFQAPPVVLGQVRKVRSGREVAVQYAVPAGTSVRLVERGRGIAHTIAKSVRGTRCDGTQELPDGRKVLCAKVRFQPSRGPGGTRQVQVLVSRAGVPLVRKTVATFKAAQPARPSKPGALRARRVGTSVVVAFPASRNASRLTATAVLSDGRKLGFDLAASCRAVRIPQVAKDEQVLFKVAGVRYDLVTGSYARVTLKKDGKSAGPRGALPKRTCK